MRSGVPATLTELAKVCVFSPWMMISGFHVVQLRRVRAEVEPAQPSRGFAGNFGQRLNLPDKVLPPAIRINREAVVQALRNHKAVA